jgi:hypothetical protein
MATRAIRALVLWPAKRGVPFTGLKPWRQKEE